MVCYYIYHGIRAQPASLCPAPIFLFSNEPLRALSIHTPIYISHFLEDHHHHRLQIKERLKSLSRSTRVRINALTVSLSAPFVALSSASLALARPIINSSSQSVSRAVCPTVQLSDSLSVCHTCNSLSLSCALFCLDWWPWRRHEQPRMRVKISDHSTRLAAAAAVATDPKRVPVKVQGKVRVGVSGAAAAAPLVQNVCGKTCNYHRQLW